MSWRKIIVYEVPEQGIGIISVGDTWALVDIGDLPLVEAFRWFRQKVGYAATNIRRDDGSRTVLYMHRLILKTDPGFEVDHRFSDPLDNRRTKLRVVTHAQNNQNRNRVNRRNKTGIRGVSRRSGYPNVYTARVQLNGKLIWQKYFHDLAQAEVEVKAARARLLTHSAECG